MPRCDAWDRLHNCKYATGHTLKVGVMTEMLCVADFPSCDAKDSNLVAE